jgi:hypothetical protein
LPRLFKDNHHNNSLSTFMSNSSSSLSFPEAIATTQSLMAKMTDNKLNEAEIEQAVASIVSTKSGGRGFFVSYLTSDISLADNPSVGVINGLKTVPEVVSELLVKNLAMSSAMAVIHRRNNDQKNIAGSERVCRRTVNLMQQVKLDLITEELQKLQTTIATGEGDYTDFLEQWGYDNEQQEVIQKAIFDNLI